MLRTGLVMSAVVAVSLSGVTALAQDGAAHLNKAEMDATAAAGIAAMLEADRTITDQVLRHIDVEDGHVGVSVVSRTAVSPGARQSGIAHVKLDEIYYVVDGEGTMVTGGELDDTQLRDSALLGPMLTGTIEGGQTRKMRVGDIAIIPKGMAHGWREIPTETITYLIFRNDPERVMEIK